jgi:hypothetical protein
VLPDADIARVHEVCASHVPERARDEVRVEVELDGHTVIIVECRPPWREDLGPDWTRMPVAKLRYVKTTGLWTLYYYRHTGRWERYPLLGSTRRIGDLLDELASDPICIFWG